jgi:hypothetical protein
LTTYGIYSVEDWPDQNGGRWGGYRCAATVAAGEQGKLYLQKDGREHYKAKPKDDELEI